jgi:hypothetical protein
VMDSYPRSFQRIDSRFGHPWFPTIVTGVASLPYRLFL